MARARRTAAALVAAIAVLTVAGCGGDTDRGSAATTFAPQPTTGLASKLESAPPYSVPGASKWALDYTPTVKDFVDHVYAQPVRTKVTAMLTEQRLREVAHSLWITDNGIQADLVLLRFADGRGATERYEFVQSAKSGNASLKSYTIDAPGAPVVYYDEDSTKTGYQSAKAYARLDDYVVELFVYTAKDIPRELIERWLRSQIARLA